jgi:hypothetical protein
VSAERVAFVPREDRIRQLAFSPFVARGHSTGRDLADWLEAEALVDANPSGAGAG